MTTVYLDARFALDLAVNYCLLACAARLDGGAVRRRRLALAAGLGAGYGVLTLLPGLGALGHPVGAALAAAGMLLAAYGPSDRLLRREFPNLGGVAVTLEKNIPTQAGLGGGSTDAAAYLRGMDRLYGLGLGREGLRALAAELGADVPFCIDGGVAAAAGIGERLTPVESHLPLWLVITKPKAGYSTPAMYRRIDERGESLRQRFTTQEAAEALEKGDLVGLCGSLYNVFEEVTALPELSEIRQELRQSGALAAMMTGSGSAVFGIFPEEDAAKVVAEKMAESRWAICCRGIGRPE